MQKKVKLTKNEKEIEKNILNYRPVLFEKQDRITKIIKKANEKKNISLRVNNQDLELLKLRAEQEGMPYQTLISSVLHKFISGRLIEQKDIIKSIQLLKFAS
ncbi:MAG: antitoxin [Candidatus Omnitrophota bacterium]